MRIEILPPRAAANSWPFSGSLRSTTEDPRNDADVGCNGRAAVRSLCLIGDVSKPVRPGRTNDHTVPQMYLRRFGRVTSRGAQLTAALVSDLSTTWVAGTRWVGAEQGFYWGSDLDGVPHHHMEQFLGQIERNAAPAFRRILDSGRSPYDDALPSRWPPSVETRAWLAWWIATQILRTTRQRARLLAAVGNQQPIELSVFERANPHIQYIAAMAAPLAAAIYHRPWGIGFSSVCLLTSDVPVLILNGQDHANQLAAAQYWDVYLPLDPHRCLYLPGIAHREREAIRSDHRFRGHPGVGLLLNQAVFDAAVRHVFCHPDHNRLTQLRSEGRLPPPADQTDGSPSYTLSYEVLPAGYGVERKWLTAHPPPRSAGVSDDSDPREQLEILLRQLDGETTGFHRFLEEQ